MKSFGPVHTQPPQRANSDMARDFLDLSFRLESGRTLPILTRFDGPITLSVTGRHPAIADRDLAALLDRFRREAHLDIQMAPKGSDASIRVEYLPRATMQAVVPQAACFVTPNATSWADYRASRNTRRADWAALKRRTHLAVFIPADTSPQDIRDCLNEEIAQAMGPVNDLYRLPDSVFNDDNFNSVLTGFDMLMLRVYNSPELANGMTRAEVAARLPAILARLNPAGEKPGTAAPPPSPPGWKYAIEAALGPRGTVRQRNLAARDALRIALDNHLDDARMAFSWYVRARLALPRETETAVTALAEADTIYARLPSTAIHRAHIALQMAAFALSAHQWEVAAKLSDRWLPAARRAQNAALMSSFMMLKSRALDGMGRAAAAKALWLDSLGWARYGFGSDKAVRAQEAEILDLTADRAPAPPAGQGGK
ncbi:DUF2927 domain-containing protein [Solirhodobacter olei]|uniref:DUF2927 domain-containing protein n=1 Tax=Solirhodobacter olei TaxID=2493082 RepID=UPI001F4D8015|nr:DUF2927 domain-containing protein [Solirhodobacter olei]